MRTRIQLLSVLLLAVLSTMRLHSQDVAIKSNLVNDALLSPNLGVEIGLAEKWSLEIPAELNLWQVGDHKWRHWFVQPEARYWFCRRFAGHFVGVHAIGGEYNFGHLGIDVNFLGSDFRKLRDRRYEGWGVGAGVAYGYAWPVHPHWNIEAEIGIGWIYTRFDSYPCRDCGRKIDDNRTHNYVGPTKAAVNIVYLF